MMLTIEIVLAVGMGNVRRASHAGGTRYGATIRSPLALDAKLAEFHQSVFIIQHH